MHFDEEDFEVDASALFRQEAEGLSFVKDLGSTLGCFGYSKDDRIERRDLIVMYKKVRGVMEKEIDRMAHTNEYDGAKDMRARLNNLRAEFDGLQTEGVRKNVDDQTNFFIKATDEISSTLKNRHETEIQKLESSCTAEREEMLKFHDIQWTNLDVEISRINRPPLKYSKRAIELFKAETGLINLQQYEDARKVRLMLDKLIPGEEKVFYKKFEHDVEAMRQKLRDAHKADIIRLEEKILRTKWNDVRRREKESSICQQRFKNHRLDMTHAHVIEEKLKPEMSVKPSALWQKRAGYQKTAAALRGQQLISDARGKKMGTQVFVDSLVDRHNFDDIPQDTVTFASTRK